MRYLLLLLSYLLIVSTQRPHWTVPDMELTPIRNPNIGRKVDIPVEVAPDRQLPGRMRNPNLGSFVDIPVVF